MQNVERYINKVEGEIYALMTHEGMADELSHEKEEELRLLFKNLKRAEHYLEDMKKEFLAEHGATAVRQSGMG